MPNSPTNGPASTGERPADPEVRRCAARVYAPVMSENGSCAMPMVATGVICALMGGAVGNLLGRQTGGSDAVDDNYATTEEPYVEKPANGAYASRGSKCVPPESTDQYFGNSGLPVKTVDRVVTDIVARCHSFASRKGWGKVARVDAADGYTSVDVRFCDARAERWTDWYRYRVVIKKGLFGPRDKEAADGCGFLSVDEMRRW